MLEATVEVGPSLSNLLRIALRRSAQTVVVLTTGNATERHAMSATAAVPVSMDPPSMLFCINRNASSYPGLDRGRGFCLNLLSEGHQELAAKCAGSLKGEARFAGGDFATGEMSIPYLPEALANIFCAQDRHYCYGSHAIVIGKVSSVRLGPDWAPLLYHDAAYKRLGGASHQTVIHATD